MASRTPIRETKRYDGTPHPWEFARVWHLEPSPTDPDTVYAGVEDAALFRSVDGGQTWQDLPGLPTHGSAFTWQPGAGGMCLHTILLDPAHPGRIFVAIAVVGAFRSDDASKTWWRCGLQLQSRARIAGPHPGVRSQSPAYPPWTRPGSA